MINRTRKRIDTIYSRIDKIALKGKDNLLEYTKLIDELVSDNDYDNLLQCLYIYYKIENLETIQDIKRKTWKDILLNTNSNMSKRIKKLYDTKLVYQTGFDIYTNNNILLGQIIEDSTYTDETKYLIKNREYARITKTRKNFLEVKKVGITQSVYITDDNLNLSEDNNLYNRYVKAVNLLLS
jgi:hypothetical protein